ncbi:hypothetical protein ABBQ32_006518 [Trebouxia sp. C0010 RCD-2024]
MNEAKRRIRQEHFRYLEHQGLLEQLESLLNDAFACIDGTDSDKAAEKALRRQGFLCAQQVYQAAYDHLQVARCAQRLSLPLCPSAIGSPGVSTEAAGSTSHLLGITAHQLLSTHIPDLALSQKGCRALLPEIEHRLQAKAQWLADVCEHQGPIASLPQHLAAQVAAAKGGQLELVQQWQLQQQASQAYLHLLNQVLTTLTQLVQDHLLGQQQASNEVQQTWLTAHSQTLFSKLKVIEKQLLVQTYNSETMPALRKLDDHLTRAQRKLDARDEKATARLYQFDQLQPEFLELANQYRNLQEDLDHATFTLHEFQKAAADQT